MRRSLGIALLMAWPATAFAAHNPLHKALGRPPALILTGSIRLRAEAIDGQFRPLAPATDSMFSLRTTVFADYGTGPVHVGAELWDARAYGQARASPAGTGEINALELVQTYVAVDLDNFLGGGGATRLTAGRFTLDIGSRRLVSRQNFRNSTNAFTGAKLEWAGTGGNRATLLWAMPQRRLPNDPAGLRGNRVVFDHEGFDTQLFGASVTRNFALGGTLELFGYGLVEGDSPGFQTSDRHLFTPGFRLFAAPQQRRFDHDFEIVYQTGSAHASLAPGNAPRLPVRAWFAHAEIGHSFAGPLAPRIALQVDYASGDDADPVRLTRFDTLFGARRADLGPTGLYGAVTRSNILSPVLRLEMSPSLRFDGFIAWRPLWLASATDSFGTSGVRDPSGRSGRFVGHQVEARLRYWLVPGRVRLDTGAALLSRGQFLARAPGGRNNGDTRYGYSDVMMVF